ncbi:MAG TPA: endonuclease/exonuclease/phosphatase family protein [Salinimicrobium sp.]|nr:endonuclease/exonuclease/phosphatase family protein [Salinimicrobium sp.]
MKKIKYFTVLAFFYSNIFYTQNAKLYEVETIAFYNVENLFDTINDPSTFDDDRTPTGKDKWTKEKYLDKLNSIAKVISEIGIEVSKKPPAIIGLSEIENLQVLEDLISQPALHAYNYGIIQYNSPDRRGIDVALLFQKDLFTYTNSKTHELLIYDNKNGKHRVYTRDQLVVSGFFKSEKMHFIVNHWPSRFGGKKKSSYKREAAASLNRKIVDSLFSLDPYAKIMTMGDFNDDPSDKSFMKILKTKTQKQHLKFQDLYNPMATMARKGHGTSAYRDSWNFFDQIILTESFLNKDYSKFQFYKAEIFRKEYLFTKTGQYRGYPFRSYGYEGYTGGYSDHFPVLVYLIREVEK